jgi:hypothetical protein
MFPTHALALPSRYRLRGSNEPDQRDCWIRPHDAMSDELLVFIIGLLGGCIATLAFACVLAPSYRRRPGAGGTSSGADPGLSAPVSVATSFMRVDLLRALHDTNPFMKPSVVDGDDLDLELRLLLGRYGKPSGP